MGAIQGQQPVDTGDSDARKPIHGNVTVTLTDELGGKHVITAKDILIHPG
ncbi:MAG: hypothetical protein ACJ72H_19415 [Candidatus Sulfotelmatobacter sp.]